MSDILIAAVLFAVAAVLLFIGMPAKNGESPSFLRFRAAVVLYPPVVLVFLAAGFAAFFAGLSPAVN